MQCMPPNPCLSVHLLVILPAALQWHQKEGLSAVDPCLASLGLVWRRTLPWMLLQVIISSYAFISHCVHAMPLIDVRCMSQW